MSFGEPISGAATGTSIKVVFGSTAGSVTVKAKNVCGLLSTARSKSILLHACTTISDQLAIDSKEGLSPNPTKGPVTLRFNSSRTDNYSVKVVDMVGKTVMNIGGKAALGLNTINF